MSNTHDRLKGVEIGVKLGFMAMIGEKIETTKAVELCDQLRAELERLQLQEKTEGEQIQLFSKFDTIKYLIQVELNTPTEEVLNTLRYINKCEEVAKNNIIDYIRQQ